MSIGQRETSAAVSDGATMDGGETVEQPDDDDMLRDQMNLRAP
ncbi:hypothetical protein NKZ35_31275 [Sinorhizobium meliloti]